MNRSIGVALGALVLSGTALAHGTAEQVKAAIKVASGQYFADRTACDAAFKKAKTAAPHYPEFPGAGELKKDAEFAAFKAKLDTFRLAMQGQALRVNGSACFTQTDAKVKALEDKL